MSSKNKVFWIINQYASTPETGVGGRHFYLARELAKQGHQVYVVGATYTHLLRSPPELDGDFSIERTNGFSFVWIKMPIYSDAHDKKRIFNWFIFSWKLRKLPCQIAVSPDVIIYSSPSLVGFLGAKRLADRVNAPLVFEVRDIWPLTLMELGGFSPRHLFIRFLQWIEDKAYRESRYVISNLKNSVDHMASRGMSRDKFSWIPNGFSADEVGSEAPAPLQTLSKVPSDKFVVGYAGTLGIANALDTLIEAAHRLENQNDIAIVLIGAGKERERLMRRVSGLGLRNVRFLDSVPKSQIHSVIRCFDVCYLGAVKSDLYKYGVAMNKLYDYLCSGRPIIYGVDSGAYHPVSDAGAGIEIQPESVDELVDAILKLRDMSEPDRQEMGERGRRLAFSEYEYGAIAERLASLVFK